MGALEQGLMMASGAPAAAASLAPTPPAKGTGAAYEAGGPPLMPTGIAPPPDPFGAVGQAIKMVGAAREAASQDPMQAAAADAYAKDEAARAELAKGLQGDMTQMEQVQGEPVPPRPAVPKLDDVPAAPEHPKTDPMRVFGQFLPVLAALGALVTHAPAQNALMAGTAMLNAAKANDELEYKKQEQSWLDNLKVVTDTNQQMTSEYKLALDDHNASVTDREARVRAIAARYQDRLGLAAASGGNLASLTNLLGVREKATNQLLDVAEKATTEQARYAQQQQQSMLQWAELELNRRKANQVGMGDAIGPILLKIQNAGQAAGQGLDKVLTPGEIQSLKLYMDINAQHPFNNDPGAGAAAPGGGATPFAGMPAPSAAPAAAPASAAPAAPAPAPTAAPVKPEPAVVSLRVAQAKNALRRQGVTRDQVRAAWVQQGLPPEVFDQQVK